MSAPTIDADLAKAGRARLTEIKSSLDAITKDGFRSEDGGIVVDAAAATEFKKLIGEADGIKAALDMADQSAALGAFLDAPATDYAATRQAGNAMAPVGAPAQYKTLGEAFTSSEEFKNRDGYRMREDFEVKGDLGGYFLGRPVQVGQDGIEAKDIYSALGGTQTRYSFGKVERDDSFMARPMRMQRVRDLFPVANTNANLIQYVRVLGFAGGVNAARPVPEREGTGTVVFGLKPHTSLEFQPAEAPVRTIAHYEVAHRNVLDDEPQLRSIIDTELLYGLRLAEDDQLLNGDGTGENVLGILQTPGIQVYPGGTTPEATDTFIDAIRRAATRVWLANYEPTGIVVHPFDWERMELTKDSTGQYIAAVSVTSGAESRLWRLPVTSSPAMAEGTSLVGAFGLGAKVYDRQRGNIRVSDQHSDYFIRNAVVVLAEERVALVVPRPESFVKVDLQAAGPATP